MSPLRARVFPPTGGQGPGGLAVLGSGPECREATRLAHGWGIRLPRHMVLRTTVQDPVSPKAFAIPDSPSLSCGNRSPTRAAGAPGEGSGPAAAQPRGSQAVHAGCEPPVEAWSWGMWLTQEHLSGPLPPKAVLLSRCGSALQCVFRGAWDVFAPPHGPCSQIQTRTEQPGGALCWASGGPDIVRCFSRWI